MHTLLATLLSTLLTVAAVNAGATDFDAGELDDENRGENWLTYGRTHSEQRYSPLREINADTIERLGLAWSVDLPDARQLVATTLAVDGVLYVTGSFSVVTAIDARTQKVLWRYDPEVTKHAGDTLRVLWSTSRGPSLNRSLLPLLRWSQFEWSSNAARIELE